MPSVLITRPRYEAATHYLYHWAGELVIEAEKRKVKIYDLEKTKANKKTLESYLKKQNPDVVILNGHGNEECVTGNDDEVLVSTGENLELFKGRIVFARACSAGKSLGVEMVKSGTNAFVGYRELFRFYSRKEMESRPLEDDFAKPFFESSNQVGISLIKGKTAKEAHDDSLKVYRKTISQLLTSNAQNAFVVPDLFWNMSNQVCLETTV